MAIGLIGRKAGMTRLFTEDGASIPVTLIEVEPNRVTQVKTEEIDGYRALQVTVGTVEPVGSPNPWPVISPRRGLLRVELVGIPLGRR
jgi:ribosomal protein L3